MIETLALPPVMSPWAVVSSTLLEDKGFAPYNHRGPVSQVVEFEARADTVATTYGKVNLAIAGGNFSTSNGGDGLELDTAQSWERTIVDVDPDHVVLIRDDTDSIDIAVTTGAAGNTDLSVVVTVVRM
jgi:hypothetical protein